MVMVVTGLLDFDFEGAKFGGLCFFFPFSLADVQDERLGPAYGYGATLWLLYLFALSFHSCNLLTSCICLCADCLEDSDWPAARWESSRSRRNLCYFSVSPRVHSAVGLCRSRGHIPPLRSTFRDSVCGYVDLVTSRPTSSGICTSLRSYNPPSCGVIRG